MPTEHRCPLCDKLTRSLTSNGVCSWCDNTQGETPDPDDRLGKWLAEQRRKKDEAVSQLLADASRVREQV